MTKVRDLVTVSDYRHDFLEGHKDALIGINWAAIGTVDIATARRFARHVLKVCDVAGVRIIKAKAAGYRIRKP